MKKAVFILSLIFNLLNIKAQSIYSKLFDLYGHWESFVNVLECDSSNCILLGASRNLIVNDSTKYGIIFISKMNKYNIIEKTNKIQRMYYTISYPNTIKNLKNKLVFGLLDTNNSFRVPYKIIDYDSNLQFYNEKDLKFLPATNLTNGDIYFNNNKLYFFCADYTTFVASKLKLSMQCMDTNGNLHWGKVFQDKRCYTNNVVQTKDGNYILAGLKYFGESPGAQDSAFAWYAKVDTLGNMIWEKVLNRGSAFLADDMWISEANNNYYLTGSLLALGGNHPYDLHNDSSYCTIAKINESNGEIIWHKQLFTNRERIQGLYTVINNLTYKNGSMYGILTHNVTIPSNEYVMFAKFDLQGNILWKRLFQQATYSNRAYSLTPTEDGFLICGDAKDSTHTKGDSDTWLIKTDTNGCIIPGCNVKDGIVQIINPEKVFTVYPNPAQSEINVSTENLDIKIESLAVYNMQGQLLKTVSKTTKINTEDLANGNYLLIITTSKQQMAGKKFVVER